MSQSAPSRKRSASAMSLSDNQDTRFGSQLPSDSINPLSHTPSVLRQLRLAGLAETDQPPSRTQPRFPHRAWQDSKARSRGGPITAAKFVDSNDVDEEEEDEEMRLGNGDNDNEKPRRRKRDGETKAKYASEKSPFRPLVRAIYGFLDQGRVTDAKRAFGMLVRSHVHGKPVDIRRNNYWALGAEILMRQGGSSISARDGAPGAGEMYPASNVPRVREYFQDLIQRYPYNFKYRAAVSAVDFWPALLSYEVFQVHKQQSAHLQRLHRDAEEWEDDSWQEPSSLGGGGGDIDIHDMIVDDSDYKATGWQPDPRDRRLRQARDQIRLRTLDALREIAGRMDDLLEDRPFSHSHELLRLRGMVSLYIGDLLIPALAEAEGQMAEARIRRDAERNNARSSFQKMAEHGGRPDAFVQEMMVPADHDEGPILPVFSSLPIREYRTAI
ncbi:hypothetical protein CH063_02642 [Colletotrichum higginsianum]|uniref:RNA polymerase I-specific transcription initiation factor rrn11 n=1 Tax=Colletotrichum higginsianum (strain IMI 349063) TaxID=759273 RepID=H1VN45_COLHI|nr:hypothetical protein CH63R_04532 [Colletotrichum higginsianum IMI 349063]OBR12236.1 hypothetical protein CH63R_04532 [Colletotrichum higginsianum IMI 349063]CCF41649.1 hypothetical protein CH063_02642 [Colletotrichum higginsianum]